MVFAYAHELQGWLDGGTVASDAVSAETAAPPRRATVRIWPFAALLILLIGGGLALWRHPFVATPHASPEDPLAAEYYRAGLHDWQTRTPSGLARAIADFNTALRKDPNYANAYAGLADAYNLAREFGTMPPGVAYPRAHAAALRAVQLDPSLASAHAALAFTDFYWRRDVAGARREFASAISIDPNSATAHHWYATFLMTTGDFRAALREIDRAAELDSESAAILADKALILHYAGQRARAAAVLKQIETDQPLFASPHLYLSAIDLDAGDNAAYVRELQALAIAKRDSGLKMLAERAAQGLASGGRAGMLTSLLQTRLELFRKGEVTAYSIAETFAALGATAPALSWLAASANRHEPEMAGMKIDPAFARLRTSPAFSRILRQAGV